MGPSGLARLKLMALKTITEHTIPVAIKYMALSFVIVNSSQFRGASLSRTARSSWRTRSGIGRGVHFDDLSVSRRALEYHQEPPTRSYKDSHHSVHKNGSSKLCAVLDRGVVDSHCPTDLHGTPGRPSGTAASNHNHRTNAHDKLI